MMSYRACVLIVVVSFCSAAIGQTQQYEYVPAPALNPLKGLVPYAGDHDDRFPHSMEFNYVALSQLLIASETYDWSPLENLLDDIAGRGHQAVFRVWLEYPGYQDGIPQFLEDQGLHVTKWRHTDSDRPQTVRTPDYSNAILRRELQRFIAALGKKYDGDARIGYITAGLLGLWGEWHTYPREELMADKSVQSEVMDAYERSFRETPILLRYPAGRDAWAHAANDTRKFGYHDDSFAWATLDTGREEDDWFFVPALRAAGEQAEGKWRSRPIGGEIRPELWGTIFDPAVGSRPHARGQDFAECVRQTHATWLMDTGMFREQPSPQRYQNAIREVQRMGYEFHIASSEIAEEKGPAQLTVRIRNSGVAPFYHNWPVEIAWLPTAGPAGKPVRTDWSVTELLPGQTRVWTAPLPTAPASGRMTIGIRIVNPLSGGLPVRFANAPKLQDKDGWFRL